MNVVTSPTAVARFWPKALREARALVLFAILPAIVAGWLHPKRPAIGVISRPLVEERTVADLMRTNPPILWVDARSEQEFQTGHIPNAVRLNQEVWEELLPGFLAAWHPGKVVVVYCGTAKCQASQEVAVRIRRELQIDTVFVLKNGWAAWQEAQRK
jgi:rhodanese-related sulfurtransferase